MWVTGSCPAPIQGLDKHRLELFGLLSEEDYAVWVFFIVLTDSGLPVEKTMDSAKLISMFEKSSKQTQMATAEVRHFPPLNLPGVKELAYEKLTQRKGEIHSFLADAGVTGFLFFIHSS
jgi:hypothetical protein